MGAPILQTIHALAQPVRVPVSAATTGGQNPSNSLHPANCDCPGKAGCAILQTLSESAQAALTRCFPPGKTPSWRYPRFAVTPLPGGKIKSEWNTPLWEAMLILNPPIAAKADFTYEQRENDPDFNPPNYVRRGLT